MAETVTVEGKQYLKRSPLGVLGLDIITLGIYFFVWYYKISKELRSALNDDSISPMRSLMAMTFGWLIIVPPFLALWNTAKHVRELEQRFGVQQTLEPALGIVILVVFAPANTTYFQSHLNSAWDAATSPAVPAVPPPGMAPGQA